MGAAELLDEHGLAVVRRAGQQQVRHPLRGRPGEKRLQAAQRLGGPRAADPPVGPRVLHPLRGGQPRDLARGRVQVRQVLAAIRHHCSITSNGLAPASLPSCSGGSAAAGSARAGVAARLSRSRRALRVVAAAASVIWRICSTIANSALSSTSARPSSRRRATAACCSHALTGGRDRVRYGTRDRRLRRGRVPRRG